MPDPRPDPPAAAVSPDGAGRARFAANAASNLGYFALSTVVMVWYVPFLVHRLGPAVYGVVALANALVMYAGLIADGLNTSTYRYLAIDLGRGDDAAARRTFNAAAALTLVACAVLAVPAAIVTWLFPSLFDVPASATGAARFLFASMCASLLASMVGGLFSASSQIAHRFDLRNAARAAALLVRVGLVTACFLTGTANLWYVAAGLLASAAVEIGCDVLIWRRLTPQLAFRPHEARPAALRTFVSLSGWSTLNMFGFLLLVQVDLVIVNTVFGAEATGRYGSLLLLPAFVTAIAEIVLPMLSPEIMARYAAGDRAGITHLATRAIRLLCIGLALPAGLLCGFGRPLLSLWLGPDFADLAPVLAMLSGHLAINLAVRPLSYLLTAYNRVRVQALVSVAAGGANIALALLLTRDAGWGLIGVAAAAALVWTVKNAVLLSGYSAVVAGLRWWTFLPPLAPGLAGLLGVTVAGQLLTDLHPPTGIVSLAATAGAVAGAYGVVAYALLLAPSDRRLLRGLIPRSSYA